MVYKQIVTGKKMTTDFKLKSKDELTQYAKTIGLNSWNELTKYVKNLPYGRNTSRSDFGLVLTEKKGTCSSKHALLKHMADLNNVTNIHLHVGIYKMTESNTPKIGTLLTENAIAFIPEAHCYLKINGIRTDLTSKTSDFKTIEKDIIQEIKILPDQVTKFKVDYHKTFIKNWLEDGTLKFKFDEIWAIREKCIKRLSQ